MPELAACPITRFRASWFKIKGQGKHENSAAFCITLCVTRALENGQIPDGLRSTVCLSSARMRGVFRSRPANQQQLIRRVD